MIFFFTALLSNIGDVEFLRGCMHSLSDLVIVLYVCQITLSFVIISYMRL